MEGLIFYVKKFWGKMNKYTLPLPPPLNHIYRASYSHKTKRVIFYKTTEAKKWTKEAQKKIKQRKNLLKCPLEMFATFYLKRDRDIDSGLKLLFDAFEKRVYANDKQLKAIHIFKETDKENPRVEVEIYRLE